MSVVPIDFQDRVNDFDQQTLMLALMKVYFSLLYAQ